MSLFLIVENSPQTWYRKTTIREKLSDFFIACTLVEKLSIDRRQCEGLVKITSAVFVNAIKKLNNLKALERSIWVEKY